MLSSKNISRQEASQILSKATRCALPSPAAQCFMVRSSASPAVPRYGITYFARGLLTSALLPVSVWLIHSNQDVPPFAPVWFFSWVLTLAFQTHLQCTPKLSLILHGGVYAVVAYSLQSWNEHPYPALPWAVSMLWWALYEAAEHLYVRYKAMNETIAHASILEARIRPHFLFNVLNCLRAMAPSQGPIGPALEDAAQLLRLALKPHSSFVRYCDERERLEHYLRLEQLRLEERLQVRWHVDEDVEDYDPWMPGFILQPLIENAIRHGIEKNTRPHRRCVDAQRKLSSVGGNQSSTFQRHRTPTLSGPRSGGRRCPGSPPSSLLRPYHRHDPYRHGAPSLEHRDNGVDFYGLGKPSDSSPSPTMPHSNEGTSIP